MMSQYKPVRTVIARDPSPNKETSFMVYMMSPYQLK